MAESRLAKGPLYTSLLAAILGGITYLVPSLVLKSSASLITTLNYVSFGLGGLCLILVAFALILGRRSDDDEEDFDSLTPQEALSGFGTQIANEQESLEAPSKSQKKLNKKQEKEDAAFEKKAKKDAAKANKANEKAKKKGTYQEHLDIMDDDSSIVGKVFVSDTETAPVVPAVVHNITIDPTEQLPSFDNIPASQAAPMFDLNDTKEPDWLADAFKDNNFAFPYAEVGNPIIGGAVPGTTEFKTGENIQIFTSPVVEPEKIEVPVPTLQPPVNQEDYDIPLDTQPLVAPVAPTENTYDSVDETMESGLSAWEKELGFDTPVNAPVEIEVEVPAGVMVEVETEVETPTEEVIETEVETPVEEVIETPVEEVIETEVDEVVEALVNEIEAEAVEALVEEVAEETLGEAYAAAIEEALVEYAVEEVDPFMERAEALITAGVNELRILMLELSAQDKAEIQAEKDAWEEATYYWRDEANHLSEVIVGVEGQLDSMIKATDAVAVASAAAERVRMASKLRAAREAAQASNSDELVKVLDQLIAEAFND